MRGPAPNGIEIRLADVSVAVGEPASQRSGWKSSGSAKFAASSASRRIRPKIIVSAGTSMPATTVSPIACTASSGATGFRRIVSIAQASM